jgi:hypothetical protein
MPQASIDDAIGMLQGQIQQARQVERAVADTLEIVESTPHANGYHIAAGSVTIEYRNHAPARKGLLAFLNQRLQSARAIRAATETQLRTAQERKGELDGEASGLGESGQNQASSATATVAGS